MTDAPASDEIEVSLFGPGYGESALVHIGDGDWIAIDSCKDPVTRRSVPLQYLESIGAAVSERVRLVVATHWHDDHVAGLDELYAASDSAIFVCSAAVQRDDFRKLVSSRIEIAGPSGIDVMGRILETIKARKAAASRQAAKITLASDSKLLYRKSEGLEAEVISLSPSSDATIRALQVIATLLPKLNQEALSVRSPDQNDASVVIWIEVGDETLLFGADLEEVRFNNWTEILESTTRPAGQASAFKVPHHGSKNGHHDGVWQRMLTSSPIAVVCPWRRGGDHLPKTNDITRICSLAGEVLMTADPQARATRRRDPAVVKTLREHQIEIEPDLISPGHIRLRKRAGDREWEVRLANGAICVRI